MSFAVDCIDHVEVFVSDIGQSAAWYARVLGLQELHRWDPHPVMIGAGDTKLALFQGDPADGTMKDRPNRPLRWRLVAWRTSREGFVQAQQHLRDCDVTFDGPVDHGVAESIYFEDPDGLPLEITWYR